jgi:hypothetical protein
LGSGHIERAGALIGEGAQKPSDVVHRENELARRTHRLFRDRDLRSGRRRQQGGMGHKEGSQVTSLI